MSVSYYILLTNPKNLLLKKSYPADTLHIDFLMTYAQQSKYSATINPLYTTINNHNYPNLL